MKRFLKRISLWALAAVLVLVVPLLAMRFTDQVNWDRLDFTVAFVLLFGAAVVYEALTTTSRSRVRRIGIGCLVFMALFLVWAELSVGVFGSPWAGT